MESILGFADQFNPPASRTERVELVGPSLHILATFDLRHCSRLTDFLNAQERYAAALDAQVLDSAGRPMTAVLPVMQVSLSDINFVAQRTIGEQQPAQPGTFVQKTPHSVQITTGGHLLRGQLSLYAGSSLDGFISARDPQFVPLRGVTVCSLSNPDIENYYELVLVNRTHLTSAGEQPVEDTASATSTAESILGGLAAEGIVAVEDELAEAAMAAAEAR